ncbi:MAG: hypothetical protein ABJE94_13745 [Parasphingorhabdus sp.]
MASKNKGRSTATATTDPAKETGNDATGDGAPGGSAGVRYAAKA